VDIVNNGAVGGGLESSAPSLSAFMPSTIEGALGGAAGPMLALVEGSEETSLPSSPPVTVPSRTRFDGHAGTDDITGQQHFPSQVAQREGAPLQQPRVLQQDAPPSEEEKMEDMDLVVSLQG
jgi:hypothetical protein